MKPTTKIKALLLGDSAASRQVSKNTAWLVLAEGLSSGIKFFLAIYAAHRLGATEYGRFNFAFGFVSLFGLFLDAGLNQIVVRDFARDRENEKYFPALFTLQIVLGAATIGLTSGFSFLATSDPQTRWMIVVLGLYLAQTGFMNLLLSVFRARQRMRDEVFPRVFLSVATSGLVLGALHFYPSAFAMSSGYALGAVLAFAVTAFFFQARAFPLRLSFDLSTWKRFLKNAFALAVWGGIASILQYNLDSTLLGFFGLLTENGWYTAAYKIIALSLMPLAFIVQSFFPALSLAQAGGVSGLQELWNRKMGLILCISVPLALGGIQLSDQIVAALFPSEFQPAARALRILFVAMFFLYVHHSYNYLLLVSNRQRAVLMVFLGALVLDLLLSLVLIPRLSLYGSAIAVVATNGFILIALAICTARLTPIRPLHPSVLWALALSLVSGLVMIGILDWLKLSLVPSILVGIGVYFACIFVFKLLKDQYIGRPKNQGPPSSI